MNVPQFATRVRYRDGMSSVANRNVAIVSGDGGAVVTPTCDPTIAKEDGSGETVFRGRSAGHDVDRGRAVLLLAVPADHGVRRAGGEK